VHGLRDKAGGGENKANVAEEEREDETALGMDANLAWVNPYASERLVVLRAIFAAIGSRGLVSPHFPVRKEAGTGGTPLR